MPDTSKHTHPSPNKDRLTQYGAVALSVVMVLSVPALVLLTLMGAPGGLFVLIGLVILSLTPIVLMVTATTPAVTLDDAGVMLHPLIWREYHIPWAAVDAVKVYPLLPPEGAEVNRRNFVGQRNYAPPEGIMLVVAQLPLQYRVVGFFAGEPGRGVIALTNRTHTDYKQLKRVVVRHKGKVQPHA